MNERIINFVTKRYNVSRELIFGSVRTEEACWPRWVAMLLLHEYTPLSASGIARLFNKDHASVLYAIQKAKDRAETEKKFAKDIQQVTAFWDKRAKIKPTREQKA